MKQLVLWICCLYALSPQAWATYPGPPPSQEALAAKTPLFVANRGQVADLQGQVRPDVWFTSHAKGLKLFFTNKGISYQFIKHEYQYKDQRRLPFEITGSQTAVYRFDMELLGANLEEVEGQELQAYYENFYLAHCHDGILEVPTYTKIVYKNIYPKIDWVISSRDGQIKHDFVVHPGGDPRQIRMQYRGAEKLRLDNKGNLQMSTPLGDFSEQAPISFQGKSKIASEFVLQGQVLSFKLADYDRQKTLVIDPALIWSTYYGGAGSDEARRIRGDGASSMYITGNTASNTGIATAGVTQANLAGLTDAFLLKMDLNGNRLWCTYLGGGSDDLSFALAVNTAGVAFIGGRTTSTSGFAAGFSTAATGGNLRGAFAGNTDGFVARFTATGARSWCGYLGGGANDVVNGLAVDASANVYATGTTNSDSLGIGAVSFPTRIGAADVLVAAYNQSSGIAQWFTYAGSAGTSGSGTDNGYSIVHIASINRLYISGSTNGASWSGMPTTTYQVTKGGSFDGVLFALTASSGVYTGFATYYGYGATGLGGQGFDDRLEDIAFSSSDNSLVVSMTSFQGAQICCGFPPNSVSRIFKINLTLTTRLWENTFDKAGRGESGRGVAVDGSGNAYLAGSAQVGTGSGTIPPDPLLRFRQPNNQPLRRVKSGNQPNAVGGHEAFLIKYSSTGTLLWETYHGGSANDLGFSVATDVINNVYLVGSAESSNNIGVNGFLNTYQGGRDVFVAKFNGIDNHLIVPDTSAMQLRLCRGVELRFPVKRFGIFGTGDSLIVELSNQFGTFTSPIRLGGVLGTAGAVTAIIPNNTLVGGGYRLRFRSTSPNITYTTQSLFIDSTCYVRTPNQDTVCLGAVYTIQPAIAPSSGFSYVWSSGGSAGFVGGLIDAANPNLSTRVSITTPSGAQLYAPTITYTGINDRLNLQALTDVYLCNASDSVTFQISMTDASSCPACQVEVLRDGAVVQTFSGVPSTRTYGVEGTYIVRLSRCGILSNAIKVDRVNLNPVLTAIPGDTICGGQQTLLMASASATGLVFAWSAPLSGAGASQYITQSGLYTVSVTDTISGCSGIAQRTIVSRTPALDSIRFLPISASEDTINITRLIFRIYPDSSANLPIQYISPYITGSAATGFIFYPRLAGVGTHTITCRILQAGCFTEIPATVQVLPAPTVTGLLPAYCANSPNDSLLRSPTYVYNSTLSTTVGVEANIMEASITNYNGLFTNQNQNTANEYFLFEPSRVDSPTAVVTVLYRTIVNNYDAFGALISTRSYVVGRASLTINLTVNANVRILDTSYLYCDRNEFKRLRVSPAGGKLYIQNLNGTFPNRLDSMMANSLGEVFLNPGVIHANDFNNTTYRLTYSVGLNGCGGQDTLRIVIPRAPDSAFVFRRQDNSLLGNPARVCISSTPIRMIPVTATNAFSGSFSNIPRGFFSVNNVAQAPGDTLFRLTGRTPGTRYGVSYTITNAYGCAYTRMDSIIVDSLPVMTNVGVTWPSALCSYQLPFTVSANNRYLDTLRIFRGNTMIGTTIATAPNTPASIGFTLTTANTLSNQATATSDTLRIHYRAVTQNGCVDSVNRLIRIHPRPVIGMANLDPTYCTSTLTTVPLNPSPTGGRFWSVGGNNNLDTLRRTYVPRTAVTNEQIFYGYINPITQCGDTVSRTVSVTPSGTNTLSFTTLPPPTICRLDTLINIGVSNSAGGLTPGSFTISTGRGLNAAPPLPAGTATINPDSTGEGMVYISYTYRGGLCAITTLCSLDIKTKPRVSVIYDVPFNQTVNTQIQVCQSLSDTAELIAYDIRPGFVAPSSIRFSGRKVTGDSISQRYFLRLDSVGIQTVNLSYIDANGCRADTISSIRVLNNPVPILEGVNPFYCVNSPADTILGIPTGGTWATNLPDYVAPGPIYSSFFPRTISGNGVPTTVNLAYNVVYSNGCRNSRRVDIPILARPNLTVVSPFNGQNICSNVAPFQMEVRIDTTITRQGTFSGLGVVPNTDFFNPGAATGARQLSYVYSDPATGCVDSTIINVVVNQAPVLDSLRLARDYCFSNTPLSITALDLANTGSTFTFSSNPVGVVQQITPTTANVSIANIGPALVSLRATNPLGCQDSINHVINVLSLPQGVTIGFFDTTLCQNQSNVTLNGFPATNGNDFWIQSRATGNVLLTSTSNTIIVNNTVLDNMGYYRAIYQYTDATGCANRDTVDFSVHPNPRADFQQLSFCAGDTIRIDDRSSFPLFLNFQDTLRTRQWTFRGDLMQGQTGPRLNLLNEQPGWGLLQLQVTSGAGCSALVSSQTTSPLLLADTVFIYSIPRVNFAETGGCQNDTLLLIPEQLGLQNTVNGVPLDRITQIIWRYGNGDSSVINNPGGINLNQVGYVYNTPGVYFPSLSVTNQGFCTQTTTLRLPISPTINPVNVPYSQDFEASTADWYQSLSDAQAIWQWGPYQGSRLVSGSNAWSTGAGQPYTDSLSTWLFTPCFDLQRSRRPMVKFDYAADMYNFDGVVMEYYDKAANRWRKLGERDKGLNWYNNPSNVFGLLNFTTLSQGVSLDAWTGYNRNFKTARYRLDPFKGQRFVRFRFAFGTLDGVPNTAEREGFILDNFWLGERRRNVLVEHFSNAYYPDMDTINRYVYSYVYNSYNGNDAILVQYQTKDDQDVEDPLFPQAPADYSARKLFYGAAEANIAVNGNVYQGPSLTIRQSDLDTIMLLDPDFNIQLEPLNIDPFSGTVDLKAYVTATRNLSQRSYTTYAMIVEDSLSSGPYFVTSVLRKILPMPNGVPMIRPWLVGEQDSVIQTWTVTNAALYNFSRLQAVVFIQAGDNKEVLQVVTSRNVNYTNPPVPIEQIPSEALDQAKEIQNLRLYPNPAQSYFRADFLQPLQGQNYRWRLFDVRGVLLQQSELPMGSQQIEVSVQDLPSGVYIFQVFDPQTGTTAQRQVVVAH